MPFLRRLVVAMLCLAPTAALAQAFPTKTISMIVPFAPGGTTDVLARIVAEAMGRDLGHNVIVENIAGAGGRTGTERVIRAEADGYTILFGNMGPVAASKSLFKDQRYDPRTDLKAIGIVADVPMVVAASKASGIADLKTLLAQIRENGMGVTFGDGRLRIDRRHGAAPAPAPDQPQGDDRLLSRLRPGDPGSRRRLRQRGHRPDGDTASDPQRRRRERAGSERAAAPAAGPRHPDLCGSGASSST